MPSTQYIPRTIETNLKPFLKRKEVIAIKGPRQAGKTTLLKRLEEELGKKERIKFITFENREELNLFQTGIEDFKRIARQYDRVIIDEFQYAREGGQKLKYLYDTLKTKFIVSGSSSLELTFQTGKYMVGRMFDFPLYPFSFREFLLAKNREIYNLVSSEKSKDPINFNPKNGFSGEINRRINRLLEEYFVYGGYPAVALSKSDEEKQKVLQSIEEKYLLRDIKSLLNLATEEELLRLTKFLASQIGNIVKYEELSNASGLSYQEMKEHLQILEKTYVASLVRPFFVNRRTELVKNPKAYFTDLGFRNYSLSDFRKAAARSDLGELAENHAYNMLKNLYPQIQLKYWRTKSKAEVDFVVEKDQKVYPVEVKYSSRETLGKSFYSFIEKFNPPTGLILTKDYLGERKIRKTKVKFIPLGYF